MQLNENQRLRLLSVIDAMLEKIKKERDLDAKDHSEKWNDRREEKAQKLDASRDELHDLKIHLAKKTGQIRW
jgi:hypothetical protein